MYRNRGGCAPYLIALILVAAIGWFSPSQYLSALGVALMLFGGLGLLLGATVGFLRRPAIKLALLGLGLVIAGSIVDRVKDEVLTPPRLTQVETSTVRQSGFAAADPTAPVLIQSPPDADGVVAFGRIWSLHLLFERVGWLALSVAIVALLTLFLSKLARRQLAYRLEKITIGQRQVGLYLADWIAPDRVYQTIEVSQSGIYGKDRLQTHDEIKENFAGHKSGVVIGRIGNDLLRYGGEGGVLLTARAGGGKGWGFAVPTILGAGKRSMLTLDPKAELLAITCRHRREIGQTVHVVDPLGITEYSKAGTDARINLLTAMVPSSGEKVSAQAELLASLLMNTEPPAGTKAKDFFTTSGRDLLQGLIMWFAACPEASLPSLLSRGNGVTSCERSLWGIVTFLSSGPSAVSAYIENVILRDGDLVDASVSDVTNLLGQYVDMAPETFSSIPTNAAQSLSFLKVAGWRRSLCDGTGGMQYKVSVLLNSNNDVYICIPSSALKATPAAPRVLIGALIARLLLAGKIDDKPLLLLDEVAQLGRCPPILESIEVGRTVCSPLLIIQSLAQLEEAYGITGAKTFVDAIALQVFLGATNEESAKRISGLIGSQTVFHRSVSEGLDKRGNANKTEVRHDVMSAGEILRLDTTGPAIICKPGAFAALVARANYTKFPGFAGQYDKFEQRADDD